MPTVVRARLKSLSFRTYMWEEMARLSLQSPLAQIFIERSLRSALKRNQNQGKPDVGLFALIIIWLFCYIQFEDAQRQQKLNRARQRAIRVHQIGEVLLRLVCSRDTREVLLGDYEEQFNIVLQKNGAQVACVFALGFAIRNVSYHLKLRSLWTWLGLTLAACAHNVWPSLVAFLHSVTR
jgi:hypothetical protein